MLKITHPKPQPTKVALDLKEALEKLGIEVKIEAYDGFKYIDIEIPKAKLDIEVDGIHHLTNSKQILKDLNRGYWSQQDGFNTMHIPNKMVREHLDGIAKALAEVSKKREQKMLHIHILDK
jgi:very-short-patch-repair endonuclease